MCIPIHAILAYIPNDETVLVKISWPGLWLEPTFVFKYQFGSSLYNQELSIQNFHTSMRLLRGRIPKHLIVFNVAIFKKLI